MFLFLFYSLLLAEAYASVISLPEDNPVDKLQQVLNFRQELYSNSFPLLTCFKKPESKMAGLTI